MERISEGCIPPGRAAPAAAPCRWLASLDYDGTLKTDGPIPQEFFAQMHAWRKAGLRWGINTGRSLPYLLEDWLAASPVLPDFICTCERYVYLAGDDGRLMPAKTHNEACHAANMKLRAEFAAVLHHAMDALRRRHPKLLWEYAAADPLSIEAADAGMMELLMPHLAPLTSASPGIAIQRAGRYLRFCDARFSKGTALAYVLSSWHVEAGRLFIMGDGHNDLDAFRLFPEAFCAAPVNAHPEVIAWLKKHGGHISPDAGVLSALRYWSGKNDIDD